MKIAITGGLGFIGLKLARQLIAEGHEPLLIDSVTPQIHGEMPSVEVPVGATVARVDVRELVQHRDLIDGCDAVYHLAAETGTGQSMYRIQQYVSVNDLGTAALLETISACKRRPKQLVLASSRSVYGEGAYAKAKDRDAFVHPVGRSAEQLHAGRWDHADDRGVPLVPVATPETAPMLPGSVYAATKGAQELLIAAAAPALGMKSTILRFQNVYGEGQSLRNPYTGIISIFFNRARQGMEIPVFEDGLESRDFVHVDDIVEALSRVLKADLPNGMVINVGAGQPTSVRELAETLLAVSGLSVPIRVTGQFRIGDIRHCFADISRLEKHLGFKPQVALEQGLRKFTQWATTQPVYEDQSARATEELRRMGLSNDR